MKKFIKTPQRPPVGTPERGERCQLRGNAAATGLLAKVNDRDWALVDWDSGVVAPKLVHRFELIRIS